MAENSFAHAFPNTFYATQRTCSCNTFHGQ